MWDEETGIDGQLIVIREKRKDQAMKSRPDPFVFTANGCLLDQPD
jgi:hypothetical protein